MNRVYQSFYSSELEKLISPHLRPTVILIDVTARQMGTDKRSESKYTIVGIIKLNTYFANTLCLLTQLVGCLQIIITILIVNYIYSIYYNYTYSKCYIIFYLALINFLNLIIIILIESLNLFNLE